MTEKIIEITLIYKDETRKMNFIPKSYKELKEHFLNEFEQKSSKKFILHIKEQNNQKKLIEEKQDLFQNTINVISQQDNPIIYVSEENIVSINEGEKSRLYSYETCKSQNIIEEDEENESEPNNKIYINKKSQANNNEFGDTEESKIYYNCDSSINNQLSDNNDNPYKVKNRDTNNNNDNPYKFKNSDTNESKLYNNYKCDSSINNQMSDNNDNPYKVKNEDKRRNNFNTENPYKKKNNADLNVIKGLDNDELIKDENKEKSINYNQTIIEINNKNNILNSL